MSKRSIWTLWTAGLVLSLALFTVGIGRPWLAAWQYNRNPPRLVLGETKNEEIRETLAKMKRETQLNYWVGALLPGLILVGVFIAIQRAPRSSNHS